MQQGYTLHKCAVHGETLHYIVQGGNCKAYLCRKCQLANHNQQKREKKGVLERQAV